MAGLAPARAAAAAAEAVWERSPASQVARRLTDTSNKGLLDVRVTLGRPRDRSRGGGLVCHIILFIQVHAASPRHAHEQRGRARGTKLSKKAAAAPARVLPNPTEAGPGRTPGSTPRALSHITPHRTTRHFAGSRVHRLSTAHRPSSSSSSSQLSSLSSSRAARTTCSKQQQTTDHRASVTSDTPPPLCRYMHTSR